MSHGHLKGSQVVTGGVRGASGNLWALDGFWGDRLWVTSGSLVRVLGHFRGVLGGFRGASRVARKFPGSTCKSHNRFR